MPSLVIIYLDLLTDAHGRRQENNTYVSVLVNYSYLADGTKISALRSDGSGLAYQGSLTYTCAGGSPASLEGVTFPSVRELSADRFTRTHWSFNKASKYARNKILEHEKQHY